MMYRYRSTEWRPRPDASFLTLREPGFAASGRLRTVLVKVSTIEQVTTDADSAATDEVVGRPPPLFSVLHLSGGRTLRVAESVEEIRDRLREVLIDPEEAVEVAP